MKSGELNSAECYEQSACQTAENQNLADDLDKLDLLVFQISNALRAARIRVQREDKKIDLGDFDLDNTETVNYCLNHASFSKSSRTWSYRP